MPTPDYNAVRTNLDGIGSRIIDADLLEVSGRDALAFLQGQVTSDVLSQAAESSADSCLLNNTGHLISPLVIHRFSDKLWIETPSGNGAIVEATLKRYIVRERVEIKSISAYFDLVTLQGAGVEAVYGPEGSHATWFELNDIHGPQEGGGFQPVIIRENSRYLPTVGIDLIVPVDEIKRLNDTLLSQTTQISAETHTILRVESAVPAWGSELTEKTIPLEAGLDKSISFTKGCYMGQEVIARINSRGHTNWQLVKLAVSPYCPVGAELIAEDTQSDSQTQCRVTSVANSPKEGWIGLGYVRKELAGTDTSFIGANEVWARLIS